MVSYPLSEQYLGRSMLACETYNKTPVRVKVRVTKIERKDEMNRYVVRIMCCSPFVVEISYVMTSGDIAVVPYPFFFSTAFARFPSARSLILVCYVSLFLLIETNQD